MARETTSEDAHIPQATHPDSWRIIEPRSGAVDVIEPLHSSLGNTQPTSDSDTQTIFQRIPQSIESDASLITPVDLEYFNRQDQGDQLGQSDRSIRSSARRSTSTSQSPTETHISDLEASASVIAEPPQVGPINGRLETIRAWGGFVIIGGCIGILAVFVFITLLWFGGGRALESAGASRLWQSIILSGRVAQAITLSSLLLRIVASTQAASCTSLLAALFLERRAVRISHLPHFSVARSTNDGPRALLQIVIGSGTRHMLFTVETLLMLVLTLATLGLQFSSTILLADLRILQVVTDPKPIFINTSLSNAANAFYKDTSGINPVLAIYGEAPWNVTVQPDGRGVSDTGLKQRALLPLEYPENRTMVRSYQGSAIVGNTRVACMPPILHGNILAQPPADGEINNGWVQGTLDYDASFRAAIQDSTIPTCQKSKCEPLLLDCTVPVVAEHGIPQSSICIVGGVGGDYWTQTGGPRWKSSDAPWAEHNSVYLVLSTNMGEDDWETFQRTPLVLASRRDEWAIYESSPMRYINISMCFAAFNIVKANVSMTTSVPLSHEVFETWDQ